MDDWKGWPEHSLEVFPAAMRSELREQFAEVRARIVARGKRPEDCIVGIDASFGCGEPLPATPFRMVVEGVNVLVYGAS